jgi:hypothetical protein
MIIFMDLKKKHGTYVTMNLCRSGLLSIAGFLVIPKIFIINTLALIGILQSGFLN